MSIKPTPVQSQALKLIRTTDNVLLYGASRSGKTFITVYGCTYFGYAFDGARILIARRYATDVRASVWAITIPDVLQKLGLQAGTDYKTNEQQMTVTFPGGGQIICAGLDDRERVDKILGTEYLIIYINECQDIPFSTVNTLKTRLSQKIEGAKNHFIVDLNPTTTAHWTYKLWFDKVHPQTREPLKTNASYASLQMNTESNRENLAEGYIENSLQTLIGNERNRFYLGEYTSTGGLRVFNPTALYQWPEFMAWVTPRQGIVRFLAGLDLGYNDADAFVILAFVPNEPDVWLIYEHKARRQNMEELVQAIKKGIRWVEENVPARDHSLRIYAETATIRYGHEGDNKKTASMIRDRYGLPIEMAFKRDKKVAIDYLQDDVNFGRFHVPLGGPLHDETEQTVWTREADGTIVRIIDDEAFHPDEMDAVLYPMREIWDYFGDEHKRLPEPPPPPPEPEVTQKVLDERFSSVQRMIDRSWEVW